MEQGHNAINFCVQCGMKLVADTGNFCSNCGASLTKNVGDARGPSTTLPPAYATKPASFALGPEPAPLAAPRKYPHTTTNRPQSTSVSPLLDSFRRETANAKMHGISSSESSKRFLADWDKAPRPSSRLVVCPQCRSEQTCTDSTKREVACVNIDCGWPIDISATVQAVPPTAAARMKRADIRHPAEAATVDIYSNNISINSHRNLVPARQMPAQKQIRAPAAVVGGMRTSACTGPQGSLPGGYWSTEQYWGQLTWAIFCFLFWPIAFCPVDVRQVYHAPNGVKWPGARMASNMSCGLIALIVAVPVITASVTLYFILNGGP